MTALLFDDVTLLDCTGADPRRHAAVLVEDGRITRIDAAGAVRPPEDARRIDGAGMTLMPGLTDAHVHFGLIEHAANEPPESHVSYVLKVIDNIRIALDEGFTTVRDAGGLDPAFALAVDEGQIAGPRILPSGSFITITGGHGDQRPRWSDEAPPSIPGLIARPEIVDGVDAVRHAARKQIRRGATQVKLMVSGGVMSPNDPIESLQFSVEEMRAAVQEAASFGTYVMAHAHTAGAVARGLDAGVRSFEHGSILDEATAKRMATQGAFLVPTLVILDVLARAEATPDYARKKLDAVRASASASTAIAAAAGVAIGSGSDLLGPRQRRRASELVEKARRLGPMEAIVSATRTNSALFRMLDRIGTIEVGKDADLILVDGDPLADITVLVDAANIRCVVQRGRPVKDCLAA
jgi:imidazolonepropionase-like amidohydrolase